MTKRIAIFLALFSLLGCSKKSSYREITLETYRDKMKAAWIGQMAGVGWGLPTEFKFIGEIIPGDRVPEWMPSMVNQQGNDDLYVEMTFLASMEQYGIDVSIRQAGIDFANTGYGLWAANKQGRENLRHGIAPPASSHPEYNVNCEDIDYQIEADYSGIIAPGMPNVPIQLGEKFGRLMNYGDGMWAGQFVGGMYAAAYFSDDIEEIILAGLQCIPPESNYAQVVKDVMQWHSELPDDWQACWELIMDKYYRTLDHHPFHRANPGAWVGIDAKVNGAFIVLGLLYGEGDMEKTIRYSMQCGLDSDCNPSNAAGILATTIGYEKLDAKYKTGLDPEKKFSYTNYNFNDLLRVSEGFTRKYIENNGGKIKSGRSGKEVFQIPVTDPGPSAFTPAYNPAPVDPAMRYSEAELSQILAYSHKDFEEGLAEIAPGWEIFHGGKGSSLVPVQFMGRRDVIKVEPMTAERGAIVEFPGESLDVNDAGTGRTMAADGKAVLSFSVAADKGETWKLNVSIPTPDGRIREERMVGGDGTGWNKIEVPFSYASNKIPRIQIGIGTLDDAVHAGYIQGLKIATR